MPRKKVAGAKVHIHDRRKWIELDCAPQLHDGLVELAQWCKDDNPKKVVSG
jgi:hypothetical protein